MLVRPGRLLPSVIVGALVTGALALGAGAASAAEGDPCVVDRQQGEVRGGNCAKPDGTVLGTLARATLGTLADLLDPPSDTPATGDGGGSSGSGDVVDGVVDGVGGVVEGAVGGGSGGADAGGDDTDLPGGDPDGDTTEGPVSQGNGSGAGTGIGSPAGGPAPGAPPSSGMPAPDVRALAAPMAAAAPGGLAAMMPTLNFGAPNVGLLAPLGSPLRPLTGLSPASPVTTTSDVQAMAVDSVPGGLGTPAVVGTLILSALAAFALRHRVLHRARRHAEAETVETPVRASAS